MPVSQERGDGPLSLRKMACHSLPVCSWCLRTLQRGVSYFRDKKEGEKGVGLRMAKLLMTVGCEVRCWQGQPPSEIIVNTSRFLLGILNLPNESLRVCLSGVSFA